MKRALPPIYLVIGLFMAACGSAVPSSEPVVAPAGISVQIQRDYCPSLEIQAGMQVVWTNVDDIDRALWLERKDEQGTLVESGGTDLLQPGSTFAITLTDPGEYVYYCSNDRGSFGTIAVSP